MAAAALGAASGIMMARPLALQLRNLQSLVVMGADKNITVVFPAPLMAIIAELHRGAGATPPTEEQGPSTSRRKKMGTAWTCLRPGHERVRLAQDPGRLCCYVQASNPGTGTHG